MNRRQAGLIIAIVTVIVMAAIACKRTGSDNSSPTTAAVPKATPRAWEYKQDLGKNMEEELNAVAFSPDGSTLAVVGMGPTTLWEMSSKKFKQMLVTEDHCLSVAFSPDQSKIATGQAWNIYLWDTKNTETQNEKPLLSLTKPGSDPDKATYLTYAVVFSPDGKTLATINVANGLTLRDPATLQTTRELKGHSVQGKNGPVEDVGAVRFSPDGKTIATCGGDATIKLWDAATGNLQRTLQGHEGSVFDVRFSPDGLTLVSAGSDKTLKLWDAKSGALLQTLSGHGDRVGKAVFSPDGSTIASCSEDKSIRLWNAQTGTLLQTFNDNARPVMDLAFSPDGQWLVSVSLDGTIKLYAPKAA